MQDTSFEQLAAEAATGLQSDRELYLDIKEELRTHLEEKADRFAREEHEAAECVALAKRSFGSPLDVAAELRSANRGRLRLRSALRIAFAALVVPLAILLALYVGYGRFARSQGFVGLVGLTGKVVSGDFVKLPTLPGMAQVNDPSAPPANAPEIVRQLAGNSGNAPNILRYWELHRDEPDGPMYYALYAVFANDVASLKRGEQIEPQNALYNVLLAENYLKQGVLAQDDRTAGKHGEKLPDELLDRHFFALGNAELLKAARKPYLRTYQMVILQKRLNALPPPRLTEDYLNRIALSAAVLFPYFSRFRDLARNIPGCARLLIADGQPREAEAVMDTWRPLTGLFLNDDSDRTLIQGLVALAIGCILSKEGAEVYDQLGATAKAADARAAYARLSQVKTAFRAEKPNTISEAVMRQHISLLGSILYPVFGGERPTLSELTAGRMHEHVLFEEAAIDVTAILLLLAMLGTLLQGKLWLLHLRRASAVPILLMPPARVLLRAVLLGTLLPMLLYEGYSRLPGIGGREYGWGYMWPRFTAELLLLAMLLLWLPAHLLRKYIRRRCDDLGVPMPDATAERAVAWKVRVAVLLAFILLAFVIRAFLQYNGILDDGLGYLFAAVLSLALLVFAVHFAHRRRREFGLYYGTLARSLAPVYAWSVIVIMLVVQPCLLYSEAHWLRNDPLMFGHLADRQTMVASFTTVEARACERLTRLTTEALQP